jgi:hypothetical protein
MCIPHLNRSLFPISIGLKPNEHALVASSSQDFGNFKVASQNGAP